MNIKEKNNSQAQKENHTMEFSPQQQQQLHIQLKNHDKKQEIIKNKHNELRKNVEQLKQSMNEALEQDYLLQQFHSHPKKLKQIENFLKNINRQKEMMKKKREDAQKRQNEIRLKQQMQKEQQQKRSLQRRHQELKQKFKLKLLVKKRLEEESQKKKLQYLRFLEKKSKEVPLYRLKQQEFIDKYIVPQYIKKSLRIQKIKQQRKPIDFDQLNNHDKKYLQIKKIAQLKKQNDLQLRKREIQESNKQYYKGKYRYLILEQMVKNKQYVDPREVEKINLINKKREYAQKVRQQYSQRIKHRQSFQQDDDFALSEKRIRRRNLNMSLNETNQRNQQKMQTLNPRLEGLKNLDDLHRMINEYKQRGLIKKQVENTQRTITPKRDYLKQLKMKRKNHSNSLINQIENCELQDIKNFQQMKLKADMFDKKLLRKEKLVRNQMLSYSQKAKLEESYLEAIKAKISLLNVDDLK